MKPKRVLVVQKIPDAGIKVLESTGFEVVIPS